LSSSGGSTPFALDANITGVTGGTETPIPATLQLLGSALAGAWLWGRRRYGAAKLDSLSAS